MRAEYDRREEVWGRIKEQARREAEAAVQVDGEADSGRPVELSYAGKLKWMWGVSRWRGGDVFAHGDV